MSGDAGFDVGEENIASVSREAADSTGFAMSVGGGDKLLLKDLWRDSSTCAFLL